MKYDLIVLGSGSAARDAAKKAATRHGAKVALVESTRWGGSCPNVACKPTKAYLVVADLVHEINAIAGKLGIEVGPARVDMPRAKARKDSLKKPQPKWVEDLRANGFDTYEGEATLVEPHKVRVGHDELKTERILIATGSRTAVPPIDGIEEIDWIAHVSALELTELPASLLVVGAGAVGLEFGQIFARFGSRVTIVDAADQIAPRSDVQSAAELQGALEEDGIEVLLASFVKSVRREGSEIVAMTVPRQGNGSREVRVAKVLIASGRAPNVEALNLEQLGIETHKLGIVVNEHMRTSAEGIWAVGDVTGMYQFTPIAQYEARIAVDDMFGDDAPSADYSFLPTVIFTHPELAGVGSTEDEASEKCDAVVHELKYVQRASYKNDMHGLYKLVYERDSRRVVGLHVVSPNAGDIVQGFALAMKSGATVDDIAGMHHAFPTFAEGVKAAAEKAGTIQPAARSYR